MDILFVQLVGQHAGDRTSLGDLFGLQALTFEHVHEIGVAAEVELVGVVELHAAVDEETGEGAVEDGGAHLALDVITDDGQVALHKTAGPVFRTGDENRDGVDHTTAGIQDLLDIPLGGHLGTDRQVIDDDVGFGVLEDLDDVSSGTGGFGEDLAEVLAQAVVGHAARDGHIQFGDIAELVGVVGEGINGFGQVLAHLGIDDIEGGGELNITDVITAQVDVHQAGDAVAVLGILIKMNPLDERGGTVTHPDDGYAHFFIFGHGLTPVRKFDGFILTW